MKIAYVSQITKHALKMDFSQSLLKAKLLKNIK